MIVWFLEMDAPRNLRKKISVITDSAATLNRSLPRMLPMHRDGASRNIVDEMLVNSSGRLVTADSRMPPMNAPDRLVFLSSRST